jgi:hypothetical protein
MHGDMFAKHILIANTQSGWLVSIFQVLRRFSDNAARKESVPAADGRSASQINMRTNDTVCAYLNSFIYYAIRPDLDRGVQTGFGMNNRRRMNHE